jgi:hypothetical protein
MTRAPLHLLALVASLGTNVLATAQENPPPWWRVADNVTVSLYWSFDGPTPFQPTLAVVPPWYSAAVTGFVPTGNVVVLPGLSGNGVGLTAGAAATAALDLTVDNDPYPDWVKVFFVQFDAFEGAGSDVVAELEKSLNYDRAIVAQSSVSLGGGWERVTLQAQLIPQPDDEGVDWSFVTNGQNAAVIDNLYVNSKCVKPGPDRTGDAMGDVGARQDLSLLPGNPQFNSFAVTEGPGPAFQRTYWGTVRATSPGVQHALVRFTGSIGSLAPAGSTLLGSSSLTSPQGPGDLAIERVFNSTGLVQQIVWVLVDDRPTGTMRVLGVDTATPTAITILPLQVPVVGVPTGTPLGLAFDPSGEEGRGTFWVSSTNGGGQGQMREYSRDPATPGQLLDTRPLPPDTVGLAYDDTLGNFYAFSRALQATPTTPIRVNGVEISGYDFERTGVRFCGDLTIPNPGGDRGGVAASLACLRSHAATTSQLDFVCLVDTTTGQWLYELAGPFAFGWSVLGRCGLRDVGPFGGVPFRGSTIEVTLTGVPNTLFAALFLGFSNQTSPFGPLPLDLSLVLGWPESRLLVAPDVNTALVTPAGPGRFVMPIAIPATVLPYTNVFFQWLTLDSGIPGFFAMSQGGKTVIYP